MGRFDCFHCKKCKDKNYIISCKCGCEKIIFLRGRFGNKRFYIHGHSGKFGPSKIVRMFNENNPMWKGDNVGKTGGLHSWVRSHLSKPEFCEVCNKNPPYDLCNITGVYNRDFSNWQYQCRRCHMISDNRILNNLIQYKQR